MSSVNKKLKISSLATNSLRFYDERKLCIFYVEGTASTVAADALGGEWKGRVVGTGRVSHEARHLDLQQSRLLFE